VIGEVGKIPPGFAMAQKQLPDSVDRGGWGRAAASPQIHQPGGSTLVPRVSTPATRMPMLFLSRSSDDQHGVPVAEEPVLLPDGLPVRSHDKRVAAEGPHQHEQRRAG
jgi:hypothetical protein